MNVAVNSNMCTGCGMCTAICSSSAIRMQADEHGFLHPRVDAAKCTDCGLCIRKCPISALPLVSANTDILTGYAKDETLLPASSSGAIFPVLAAEIIHRGGIVFGAAFDENFDVVHTAAETLSELAALCSSKYVQSRIPADCYSQVKRTLADGRWIYFSGMPCQVAALKNYLGREYETLITQDTACHSVPSPMVWKDYAAALEKQHIGKLTCFSFRNKANGWEDYYIRAEFDSSKVFQQPATENPYQRGFLKGLYSRNSCFSCRFKGVERCSDITLADYWGVKGIQPETYNSQGISLILLHSDKGRALLESCKDKLQTATAEDGAFAYNPAVLTPTFIGCMLSAGIEYAQYRYSLGMAEADDVICNTLGAFVGSASLLIAHIIEKSRERVRHTNMTLTANETQFLHIAKVAISGGDLAVENVDWPATSSFLRMV